MKSIYALLKRSVVALLVCTLVVVGVTSESAEAAKADDAALVYYVSSEGDLYSVKTDGSSSVKVREQFAGIEIKPAGNYLYYIDEDTNDLMRFSLYEPTSPSEDFDGDVRILDYITVKDIIYFMNDKGAIYHVSANAKNASEAKLIVGKTDMNTPVFTVEGGRVYYNALRDESKPWKPWVAARNGDGTGQVQWIAAGAFEDPYYVRANSTIVSLMVNTIPSETEFSIDCIVQYTVPINGGIVKAINAKNPLDTNAVYSGSWTNDYYMYNKGILYDTEAEEYDYTKGKGFLLQQDGKSIQLHKTTIDEIVDFGKNKLAFVDSTGTAYVNTIANAKVTSTKPIALKNIGYVRNIMNNKAVKSTILFGGNGTYTLNADLSVKTWVGFEWDDFRYEDDIAGVFFSNMDDNSRLYRMSDDGNTSVKLADEEVYRILFITKP